MKQSTLFQMGLEAMMAPGVVVAQEVITLQTITLVISLDMLGATATLIRMSAPPLVEVQIRPVLPKLSCTRPKAHSSSS